MTEDPNVQKLFRIFLDAWWPEQATMEGGESESDDDSDPCLDECTAGLDGAPLLDGDALQQFVFAPACHCMQNAIM